MMSTATNGFRSVPPDLVASVNDHPILESTKNLAICLQSLVQCHTKDSNFRGGSLNDVIVHFNHLQYALSQVFECSTGTNSQKLVNNSQINQIIKRSKSLDNLQLFSNENTDDFLVNESRCSEYNHTNETGHHHEDDHDAGWDSVSCSNSPSSVNQSPNMTRIITDLHQQISHNQSFLRDLLDKTSTSIKQGTSPTELLTLLNQVYTELIDSERLRVSAESRAEQAEVRLVQQSPLKSREDVRIDCACQTNDLIDLSLLVKHAFVSPNQLIDRLQTGQHQAPLTRKTEEACVELEQALRNALGQITRLTSGRRSLKLRVEQLTGRLDQVNLELDSTVDVLRRHQTNTELARQRSSADLATLRSQLANSMALLERHGLLGGGGQKQSPKQAKQLDHTTRAFSTSPNLVRASSPSTTTSLVATVADPNDRIIVDSDDLDLQLSVARHEVAQLRHELSTNRKRADREAGQLRGQLEVVQSDARALRRQLTRLMNSTKMNSNNNEDTCCSNCNRMERLVTILQTKQSSPAFSDNPHSSNGLQECAKIDQSCQTDTDDDVGSCGDPVTNTYQSDLSNDIDVDNSVNIHLDAILDSQSHYFTSSSSLDQSMFDQMKQQLRDEWTKLEQGKVEFYELLRQSSSKNLVEGDQELEGECDLSNNQQLLSRLKMAQLEAERSMDQLKASNIEFLALREQLMHASTESAYLKSTVEGLDEQVTLLESSLYNRTQEFYRCQAELDRLRPKDVVIQFHRPKQSLMISSAKICSATVVQLPVDAISRRTASCFAQLRSKVSLFLSANNRWTFRSIKSSLTKIASLAGRSRFQLRGQPRPRLLTALLVYFVMLHFLLAWYWL